MIFATTKFKKGDRVRQTKSWDDHSGYNSRKKQRTGTVVGFSRNRKLVWIIPDGTKTRTAWHPDYWAVVPTPIVVTEPDLGPVPEIVSSDAWSTLWSAVDRMLERIFGPYKHSY